MSTLTEQSDPLNNFPVLCALCASPVTERGGAYHGLPLCATCSDMAREYGEKVEARIERLEDRAASKHEEAIRQGERAREATRGIEFGQPILVGHHSEKRHRAALAKSDRAMHNAYEAFKESEHLERRAEAARDSAVISSDDPLAILKLIEKIAYAEKSQERMKAANKIIRNKKLSDDQKVTELETIGIAGDQARTLLHPGHWGKGIGYEGFELTNNGANIRRMKERLEDIRGITARRIEAAHNAATPNDSTELLPGVEVVRNQLENRLQVLFPGKPSEAVRGILKARGFRWSPSQGAWQRQLNNGAEYALECVLRELRDLPEYQTVQVATPESTVVEEGEFNTDRPCAEPQRVICGKRECSTTAVPPPVERSTGVRSPHNRYPFP